MRSPGGAGDLFRSGSGDTEQIPHFGPRPVVVKAVGDAGLPMLHIGGEAFLEILDRLVLLLVGLLFEGAEEGGVGGVQGLGHAPRVRRIQPIDKQCLTPVADRPTVFISATSSTAWRGVAVHSYPAPPADGTQQKTDRNACDSYIAHVPARHTTRFSERNP